MIGCFFVNDGSEIESKILIDMFQSVILLKILTGKMISANFISFFKKFQCANVPFFISIRKFSKYVRISPAVNMVLVFMVDLFSDLRQSTYKSIRKEMEDIVLYTGGCGTNYSPN